MNDREECARLAAQVAEVGAAVCCYAPGHGDPERWPTSKCDCKFGASGRGEQTGCPEARTLYRMLTPSAHLGASECAVCEGDGRDHGLQEPERSMNPCPNCNGKAWVDA